MGFIDSLSIIKLQGHKDFNIHVQFCCLKTFNLNVDQWKFRVGGGWGGTEHSLYYIVYTCKHIACFSLQSDIQYKQTVVKKSQFF